MSLEDDPSLGSQLLLGVSWLAPSTPVATSTCASRDEAGTDGEGCSQTGSAQPNADEARVLTPPAGEPCVRRDVRAVLPPPGPEGSLAGEAMPVVVRPRPPTICLSTQGQVSVLRVDTTFREAVAVVLVDGMRGRLVTARVESMTGGWLCWGAAYGLGIANCSC